MQWQTLTEYYDNGKVKLESLWNQGTPDGVIRGFTRDGKRDFEIVIENGVRVRRTLWKNGETIVAAA